MTRYFGAILTRRWLALAGGILLLAVGVAAWMNLPIDAFPDVTNVQVMVLTRASGLSAEEVEQRITYPIEQQMGGLPRLEFVRSVSRAGLSQVVAVFRDGTDAWFARQVVFERIQGARESLPAGVEPELGPLSTGLGEIFQYTVEGDSLNATERRTIQDWLVAPRLRTVRGVTEVNSFGGFVRQHHVLVHPDRLLKYGLTLREVVDALERNNANAGAGFIVKGWEQTYILGLGTFARPEDIGRVVLAARDGVPVTVGDVADIADGTEVRQGAVGRDGRGETVAGMVIMLRGENSRTVVERVKTAIAGIQGSLPRGARLDVFYDRTGLIQACVRTVVHALLEGGLLVILVLFLFLAELRTALIVVLSLPLTFACVFVLMGAAGLSANLMSLGGLSFAVGLVVDAAIVVVENVRRHLARAGPGAHRRDTILAALVEVVRPVIFAILIIAIVVVPLLALQGVEGKMFRPLTLTLLFALLSSITVAITVVPALSDLLLAQTREREFAFVRQFKGGYLSLLKAALARPRVTIAVALVALLITAALAPRLGTEFLPALDEGSIAVNVVRLPNASLDGSVAVAAELERRALAFPEVATVVSKTGRAEISEDPMGPEQTDLFIMLKPHGQWSSGRSKAELVEALNREFSAVPGLRFSFSQPIGLRVNELISGVKSDLAVKIFGPDLEVLTRLAQKAGGILQGVSGASDVKVEQVTGMTELVLEPDRGALARYGLNVADVNELLETGVAGRQVGTFIDGQRRQAILLRLPEEDRRDVAALERLLLTAPDGSRVPLGQVARIAPAEGPAQVSRENGMRRVVIEANVRDRDLGGFVADVQAAMRALNAELPAGYYVTYGGQFENQERAMRTLAMVVPLALLLIAGLLYGALGSVRNALLVILNLPFALVGGVGAALALGMHLSVSAAVAFIVLLGIAVQNGVVLFAFLKQLRERGLPPEEAAVEGCRLRFKPLLMTALTALIGQVPMLFASGAGADIQRPLAAIVMGGIVTSSLLTLVVLPALWLGFEKRAERRQPAVESRCLTAS